MRVIYFNCHRVPVGWTPDEALSRWPTLRDVPAALVRAGVQVAVVQAAPLVGMLRRDGVTFRFTPGGPRRLAAEVAACDPDVIHQQSFRFPAHTRALHRRLPHVPVLVQDHGGSPPEGWRRLISAWGARHIAGAAFTAREQAAPFVSSGVLRPDVPVYEVLESSTWFTPGDQATARAATGLAGDPGLLWIGRLNANKDPHTVLGAVRAAMLHLPNAHLWCYYTDAPLLPTIRQQLAGEPELSRRVHLMGAVPHEQIEALCRAADFLVLGSHAEGSGYAVLEALACGTTPLVTDIPSFRRLTSQGAVGALLPPGDAAAMARAIVEWSRRDRAALRAAARRHFEQSLSFAAVGRDLKVAYEALAANR